MVDNDTLLNTISNELKNYIVATNQAMEQATINQPALSNDKYILLAMKSNTKALDLVQEILYSAKIVAAKETLNLKPFDLNEIVEDAEDIFYMRAANKHIEVVGQYSDAALNVLLDFDKWTRIYENLTTNAIKFTDDKGAITVKTYSEDDHAVFSIKDSGIGIPPENLAKLFSGASDVSRKGTAGEESTGLGLTIVKKLVDLHNGTIEVKSKVGEGTEFIVKLPLAK
ncbi:MAG: HAMP domain-containing histidine kinase [Candidatus Cloacimonetes bacterium]|nr:HAMP domain-containing histidine kinase [Candidatus Cloacimonadota bacterium]